VKERLARDPRAIRGMFAAVAPRYDLLNRLLSLRQDVRWRRRLVAALAAAPAGPVLDLASGTGDVALAIGERGVVGADFCLDMLAIARSKARSANRLAIARAKGRERRAGVRWVCADALALPFRDGAFAAVTVAFGVRNFAGLDAGLAEMRRVLAARGVLAILEFQRPRHAVVRAGMALWNRLAVTPVGRLVSHDPGAYAYLPASVATFAGAGELGARVAAAGFAPVSTRELAGGIAALTVARREGA
jgi:demethylmenaquinone methyltransferase/2-methoxy-6-polyprenyl-1,4-benzoquinol methylase